MNTLIALGSLFHKIEHDFSFVLNSLLLTKTYIVSTQKNYSKTCVKRPPSKRPKLGFKTNYCLMQVKSIAKCYHLSKFVLSIFEWPFYTGFTVSQNDDSFEQSPEDTLVARFIRQ